MTCRSVEISLVCFFFAFICITCKDQQKKSLRAQSLKNYNSNSSLSFNTESNIFIEWHQNPKAPFRPMKPDTIDLLKTRLISSNRKVKNEVFERIDQFTCPSATNMTHGKRQHYAQDYFYWAWHSGDCNGIKDTQWLPSNGRQLGVSLCKEVTRLRKLDSQSNQRQGA